MKDETKPIVCNLDKIINKKIVLFTKDNFRFSGKVQNFDGTFIELFDEVRKKIRFVNVSQINEIEISD
jgi:small nuclear ribonucleoprotein (snRNP)-like protein